MSRSRRSSSPEIQIARLQKRHQTLDQQLSALTERKHLTATDQMVAARLKKEKLAAKDELLRMKS